MRLREEREGSLVVTTLTWWPLLGTAGFGWAAWAVWHRDPPRGGDGAWAVVLLLAALACLAGLERSRFRFDAGAREVRWVRRRLLRREEGTIPFAGVTGVSLEQALDHDGGPRRSNARRVDLHTAAGVVPLTTGYSGTGLARQRDAAARIAALVGAGAPVE